MIAAPGDIPGIAGCEAAVRIALDALGGLDVLVNSAGVGKGRPIEEADEAFYDWTMNANLKGTIFAAARRCRRCVKAEAISSTLPLCIGLTGTAEHSVYCTSKGGVVMLTRSLSAELAPDMRINCVCPGYMDTNMVRRDWTDQTDDPAATMRDAVDAYAPMSRIGKPDEVAAAILYHASDQAGFVTGTALTIDGGCTVSR